MADELGDEVVASPLEDYLGADAIDLSPGDGSPSPERGDAVTGQKRRKIELSDSEEDEDAQEICEIAAAEAKEEGENLVAEDSRKPETAKKIKAKMASSLPLVFPEKILRNKILLECEDEVLDMSGDIGAVGRVSVRETEDNPEVYLDLKGTVYRTNIVPSNSYFLVNIGPSEAKVEALMNDFVQLVPDAGSRNIETMIEGTLEGMTFDSEDEGVHGAAAVPVEVPGKEGDEKTGKAKKTVKAARKPKDKPKATPKKPVKRSGGKANGRTSKKSK